MNNSKKTAYRPAFHVSIPSGWMNDPNGFCYYNGEYHVFGQHNPKDVLWGPMHWAHFKSSDFISWKYAGIALTPDQAYDNHYGCFSGSSIEKEGVLYAFYTGVANDMQTQCVAMSYDGNTFEKYQNNPILSERDLPEGYSVKNFRDPKVVQRNGKYYMLVGAKHNDGESAILLYKSENLLDWKFVAPVHKDGSCGQGMYECPDFITIDNQDVLIASPQYYPQKGSQFQNIHSVIYSDGKLDFETGKYLGTDWKSVDCGSEFYATQTLTTTDGRAILIAWQNMWERNQPTADEGWIGAFTIPRELSLRGGTLVQQPVSELKRYAVGIFSAEEIVVNRNYEDERIRGKTVLIDIVLEPRNACYFGIEVFCNGETGTKIYYDAHLKSVVLDRSYSGSIYRTATANEINATRRVAESRFIDGKVTLQILLDHSSCEVFVNGGEKVLTANIYDPESADRIRFFSSGVSVVGKIDVFSIDLK